MALDLQDLAGLIEATARRDIQAFKQLYEQSSPVLRAAARRWVDASTPADDVLQLAYTKIWDKAARFDRAAGSALAWMLRICRNVAIDEVRRNRSMQANDIWAAIDGEIAQSGDSDLLIDLRSSWMKLPPDQADALAQHYFHGHSHDELARQLSLPLGTVKSRIRRALISLKGSLKDTVSGGPQ
jgi:RNA polymerase sigma-70 factor (ECF subfamily)